MKLRWLLPPLALMAVVSWHLGVTAQRAVIWQAKRHNVVVGLDLAFTGNSEETCRKMLEQDPGTPATATCSMSIRLDLSNFNHSKVNPPSGTKKKTLSA